MSPSGPAPVLDYAAPAEGRAWDVTGSWALAARVAHVVSVAASVLVVIFVIGDARLWAAEAGSGCGWGRGVVRGGLYFEAFLLVPAAVGPLFVTCSHPLFRTSRLAFLCALGAWLTLFFWFNAQT